MTTTIKNFEYISTRKGYKHHYYNFRIGDYVRVKNWGETFPFYKKAFLFFKNSATPTYYSTNENRKEGILFKIINVAEHSHGYVIAYIKDRDGHDNVIDMDGLELVKQFPLRKGETQTINLKNVEK